MRLHTGTVTRPRFESAPYRPSPARREHIYGRIQPMHQEPSLFAKLVNHLKGCEQ